MWALPCVLPSPPVAVCLVPAPEVFPVYEVLCALGEDEAPEPEFQLRATNLPGALSGIDLELRTVHAQRSVEYFFHIITV